MIKNMFNEQMLLFSSDAQTVIHTLETCHPIFCLYDEIPGYDEAKNQYIEFTSEKISPTAFRLATQRYFKILNDSHTFIGEVYKNGMYIDIRWFARRDKLYLLDKNQKPTDIEIKTVGQIPVREIISQVDLHYPAENEAARQYHYARFCRDREMLTLAGCRFSSSGIEISTSDGKTTVQKLFPLSFEYDYTLKCKKLGDVFYIDLKAFRMDKSMDEAGEKIKSAIRDGVCRFIIDVRDNSGGNSNAGAYLLHTMGMQVPRFGAYIRNSDIARLQKKRPPGEEWSVIEPDIHTAVPNQNIRLRVLVNENTFSAAKMLGVWVQDGNLGKIVGQISRNRPNSYGDPIVVKLPLSRLGFLVSHKKFLRPDTNANPDCLVPDIDVPFGEDALSAALRDLETV